MPEFEEKYLIDPTEHESGKNDVIAKMARFLYSLFCTSKKREIQILRKALMLIIWTIFGGHLKDIRILE